MSSMYSVYDELEGTADSMVAYQACHLCHNGNKKARLPIQLPTIFMQSHAIQYLSFLLTLYSARGRPAADSADDVPIRTLLVYGL